MHQKPAMRKAYLFLAVPLVLWLGLVVLSAHLGTLHAGAFSWRCYGFWPFTWNTLHVLSYEGETICTHYGSTDSLDIHVGAEQIYIFGGAQADYLYNARRRCREPKDAWKGIPPGARERHFPDEGYGGGWLNFTTLKAGMGRGERWMHGIFAQRARDFETAINWLPFGGEPPAAPAEWNTPTCTYRPLSLEERQKLQENFTLAGRAIVLPQGKPQRSLRKAAELKPILAHLAEARYWYTPQYVTEPEHAGSTILSLMTETGRPLLQGHDFRLPCCLGPEGQRVEMVDFFR